MLLYFIRHADPIYSPDSLTPLGKRQAEALAKRLALYGLDEIYSSTSQRAKDTAAPTAEILKMDIHELDWCNECYAWDNFSVENGERSDWCFFVGKYLKIFSSKRIRMMEDEWYTAPDFANTDFANGVKRINNEADSLLEKLGYKHDRENHVYIPIKPNDKRIALFAHQGFGMAFLSSILDIPYPEYVTHFDFGHSSVSVIEFAGKEDFVLPKVLTLSNDSHLFKDGLPTKFNNEVYI